MILYKYGGNKNYSSLKNYKIISLFNIIGKILKIILIIKINYIAITYNLPLKTYLIKKYKLYIETMIYNFLKKDYTA